MNIDFYTTSSTALQLATVNDQDPMKLAFYQQWFNSWLSYQSHLLGSVDSVIMLAKK